MSWPMAPSISPEEAIADQRPVSLGHGRNRVKTDAVEEQHHVGNGARFKDCASASEPNSHEVLLPLYSDHRGHARPGT